MKILVTGKNGFIARNLIEFLEDDGYEVLSVSHEEDEKLNQCCEICHFVFHLAAVQRSDDDKNFIEGNILYTQKLINCLEKHQNRSSIIFSTSTAIEFNSIFSKTKKEAEKLLREHCTKENARLYVFKLNHVFGKYGKPNFNSVISTFCFNLANNIPIIVNDPSHKITVTYINDLYEDFKQYLNKDIYCDDYILPSVRYEMTLGELLSILGRIKNNEFDKYDILQNQLHNTYKYYKDEEKI
ncbi:NAD-dependent epimerase/dehydratase family protein [Candidatus Stoquefichus massiliensis]|uniref:NAD-dependent epimerase/dehydratase family protein n=1 Tax=Candidatus Stoquefichus massiliensis TaxID=1470350 RepID=UPI000480C987|nr:NAD-dependent epimerase/dehydratase family protein [Candidatus Stoquefichus massiliensis]